MFRKRNNKMKTRVAFSAVFGALVLLYWRLTAMLILQQDTKLSSPSFKNTNQVWHEFPAWAQPDTQHNPYNSNNNTSLEFVHITKTGGTAIEKAAAQAGITWGVCHYETRRDTCFPLRPDLGWPKTFQLRSSIVPYPNFQGEYWHIPPHWFIQNPYSGSDAFVVVRNPYDRYISEFYCRYFGYYKKSQHVHGAVSKNGNADRVAQFQQLARQKEAFQARKTIHKVNHRRLLLDDYVVDDDERAQFNKWLLRQLKTYQGTTSHLLPQHFYVYNGNGTQVITHVLKFERLQQDFVKLMKHYNLSVSLPLEHINVGYNSGRRLTRADLSAEAIQAINEFCHDDFRLFGYEMMDPII